MLLRLFWLFHLFCSIGFSVVRLFHFLPLIFITLTTDKTRVVFHFTPLNYWSMIVQTDEVCYRVCASFRTLHSCGDDCWTSIHGASLISTENCGKCVRIIHRGSNTCSAALSVTIKSFFYSKVIRKVALAIKAPPIINSHPVRVFIRVDRRR